MFGLELRTYTEASCSYPDKGEEAPGENLAGAEEGGRVDRGQRRNHGAGTVRTEGGPRPQGGGTTDRKVQSPELNQPALPLRLKYQLLPLTSCVTLGKHSTSLCLALVPQL